MNALTLPDHPLVVLLSGLLVEKIAISLVHDFAPIALRGVFGRTPFWILSESSLDLLTLLSDLSVGFGVVLDDELRDEKFVDSIDGELYHEP